MANPNKIWSREELGGACDFEPNGRSSDTYMSEIRKGLGKISRIVSQSGTGYAWIGDPVPLVSVVKECIKPVKNDEMAAFAVMTQKEVGRILGLTPQAVNLIEKKALAKLRKKPELKQAWAELLADRKRITYDPFHEIWLFSVAENIVCQSAD